MKKKKIAILGSTGSIGVSALEIVSAARDQLEVVGIAAGYNISLIQKQIQKFQPKKVSVATQTLAEKLKPSFPEVDILWGEEGLIEISTIPEVDLVVSALVGAVGIKPTLAAIEGKKDIALANKEVLIAAGSLVMSKVKKNNVRLIPVDSEHSALFQIMGISGGKKDPSMIRKVTLTASGGPFLNRPMHSFSEITPTEALKHPRWLMGARISVDSATLMNKGFEVIEAFWLFDLGLNRIEVVIHPQSIIHGLVTYKDGNTLACLSVPDMKAPIAYALSCPDRIQTEVVTLDLAKIKELSFEEADTEKFPLLTVASEALKRGGVYPCLLNAADEVAVEAFLKEKILFSQIPVVIEQILSCYKESFDGSLEGILEADQWARKRAENIINQLA